MAFFTLQKGKNREVKGRFIRAKMITFRNHIESVLSALRVTALGEEYPPLGIALVMKGHHSCKEFRGAKKKGIMTSSYLDGAILNDANDTDSNLTKRWYS